MKLRTATSLGLLVVIHGTSLQAEPITVPGFNVDVYASVADPIRLSFDPGTGDLFVGRDASGSGGGVAEAVRIHRIAIGGTPVVEYGDNPIGDPDSVLFDASGSFSGTAGSVLIGGRKPNGGSIQGHIVAIRPDETIDELFAGSGFTNVDDMAFDSMNRLIFTDNDGNRVLRSTGGTPSILFTLPADARGLAMDSFDRIYTGAADGTIRIHDADGTLLDDAFITGLSDGRNKIAFGRGGLFGTDLYSLDGGDLLRFNSAGVPTVVGTGFGAGNPDIEFSPDGSSLFVSDFSNDRILRISPIPEPSSLTLLGFGLLSCLGYRCFNCRHRSRNRH